MKQLITTLKFISIGLVILSIFLVVFSLITLQFDESISFANAIDSIYKSLTGYSGLYTSTFIVLAFWATLRQLEISQSNYNTTLNQVKFIQGDIIDKRKKDITNDTLKQCNFFLNELQVSFKELIEEKITSGMPLKWDALQTLTKTSLEEKYPKRLEQMQELERPKKNQLLITLYRLEAFSALFIHGNDLDKQLAKDIIGHTFAMQVGFLLGFISFFREDTDSLFGQNTIELYYEWKADEEKV